MIMSEFVLVRRAVCAILLGAALALGPGAASPGFAQSSSSITVNGVQIEIMGGSSQSISATDTGAEIVLDGQKVVIDGTKITLGGSSMDSGPFEKVRIDATGGGLKVFVDGQLRMETGARSASETGGPEDEGQRLNDLGHEYFNGEGVPQDVARGIELFKEAAEDHGYLLAANNLAVIYWNGLNGVPEDERQAIRYALMAEEEGYKESLGFLGHAYLDGIGVAPDAEAGIAYFNAAIEAGSISSLVHLGNVYFFGEAAAQDLPRSAALYKEAADQGSGLGAVNYANALWNGDGVEKDRDAAFPFAKKAAEKEYAGGYLLLGHAYYFGDGADQDLEAAYENYLSAAELGEGIAAFNLGIMNRDGEGRAPDLREALRWMELAAERGYAKAPAIVEELRASLAEAAPEDGPDAGAKVYWFARGQQQIGPKTLAEIRAAIGAGDITGNTLVWKDGLPDWVAAHSLSELFE